MNALLLYMVKVAWSVAALYLVYILFLRKDTMYERNRFFILLSFTAALIFPFIIIETRQPLDMQFFGKDLSGMIIYGNADPSSDIAGENPASLFGRIIFNIYITGAVIFGMKLLAEILSLFILIAKQKNRENKIIRLKTRNTSGFSAFGYIFIYEGLKPEEDNEIIKHEQKHLDRYHFMDIIFIELIKVIQWFNPFIYMFDRSLREVHEFQADEECINSGIPVQNYQGLLLNQVFRTNIFNISNSFSNPTLIKKRMIMMTRKRSKNLANLKILLVLPVVILLLITFSTCSEKLQMTEQVTQIAPPPPPKTPFAGQENVAIVKETMMNGEPEPFVVVEEMPMFPGGDSALLGYIARNTKYPAEAKDKGIQGKVIARFVIGADGNVSKVSVIKGVDPLLDAEATRVISQLLQFKPGKQGGKEVPVWYMVPITFTLGEKENQMPPPPPPPPPVSDFNGLPPNVVVVQETPEQNRADKAPFVVVEEMPQFPGGDSVLLKYIADNIRYPEYAKTQMITGKVIVRFCITATGNVNQISVLKGVHPSIDAEAIRVVSSLPQFKPGKQGGVPVPVWYMLPVTFSLSSQTNSNEPVKPFVQNK